ncbi:MAG TPA: class I SAM-dependent methyltransferase [Anaerolineales bacterium]|nr:class I SAM-dependent methyltransferase [Anaerolineales bacterium]
MNTAKRDWKIEGVGLGPFDYESKTWGGHQVGLSPKYLGALRLRYCLEDLEEVHGSVLEVGCGAGGMLRGIEAQRPDLTLFGCDVSRNAVELARRIPTTAVFEVGDAYSLPYQAGRFAAVVMFDVLEHLDSPNRALAEISRVLVPAGQFHLFAPCEGPLYTLHGLLARLGWRAKEVYGGHIQRFTPGEVVEHLRRQGFVVDRRRWSGHLVNQIVDAAYFTALSLRGKNVGTSVEGYLETTRPGPGAWFIGALKSAVGVASYYESLLLAGVPGFGVHLLCEKVG